LQKNTAEEFGLKPLPTKRTQALDSVFFLFLPTKKHSISVLDCRALLLRKENNHSNVNNNKEKGREEALVHRSPATTAKKQHSGRYDYVIILHDKFTIF
jgi:hypothetical protein